MKKDKMLWLCMFICMKSACAQNLIINGDAEVSPFVGNGWVQASGDWQQLSSNPLPQSGNSYFFAGVNSSAELYQKIDVSSDQSEIDTGHIKFTFNGYIRSFPQDPSDEGKVTVEYLNSSDDVLGIYSTGSQGNTSDWVLFNDSRIAPIGTRTIKITLTSIRNNGSDNDGYIDNLQLTKENITLSTEQFSNVSKQIKIYPNPSKSLIQVSGLKQSEIYTIYDTLGAKIKNGKVSNEETININTLTKGVYLLKFESGNTHRFIKE